jgi:imidazolonepropionase-like amidohydrolase
VPLVAGSDAGSHGVRHGEALVDELDFFSWVGLPMDAVLRSATSQPRKRWGVADAMLAVGLRADFIALAGNPFLDARNLHYVTAAFGNDCSHLNPGSCIEDEVLYKKCA